MSKAKGNKSANKATEASSELFDDSDEAGSDDAFEEGVEVDEGMVADGESSDLDVEVESEGEIDPDVAAYESDMSPCHAMSPKARAKLETKKRLDAYLEKKRLKESGWDEDDELFDDEFFSESSRPSQPRLM